MSDPYWVISSSELLTLLDRAHNGEDPDLLLAEAYANSVVEPPDDAA